MTAHPTKFEPANPHPNGTPQHAYWHLWQSNRRNAERAREAAAKYDRSGDYYFNLLVGRTHRIAAEASNV